jgi:hypothetical protein
LPLIIQNYLWNLFYMDNNNTDQLEVQNYNNEESSTSFVVSTLEDENDGDFSDGDLSLREAIALSNEQQGADTITFNDSLNGGALILNSSLGRDFNLDDDLSINGLSQDNLTLDGGFVFNVASDTDVTIDSLNFVGGTVDNSGNLTFSNSTIRETSNINGSSDFYALISREGNVNIVNSSVRDNDGGDNVGVVIESGTATIEESTIANNSGVLGAAGVIIGSEGIVEIQNSTIANNSSRSGGGVDNAGTVDISNSTIADNRGGRTAGGIINRGVTTVTSSIVANNTGNTGTFPLGDIYNIDDGVFTSGGNNLIGNGDDATGFEDGVNGDLVGSDGDDPFNPQTELLADPNLGELQNNGGSTETFALLEDSPAIDAGSNPNNLETDQRGEGFDRTIGNRTDIGAYEVQEGGGGEIPDELIVSTLEDENDGDYCAGDLSLREAIAIAENNETITFDSNLRGGSVVLSQGELLINKSLTINGLGAKNLTIDGNKESRIFQIDDGNVDSQSEVSISGLTIKNGRTGDGSQPEINGGGFLNRENLTVIDSALVENAAGNGGAIYNTGKLRFENSLVDRTGNGTGPIYNDGGIASIINSTFTNNNVPGISAIVNDNGGELGLTNSTIANNTGFGAALFNGEDSTATVASTIIAENLAELTEKAGQEDIFGNYTSNGNNLIGTTNGGSGFDDPSDIVGTADNPIDPKLGELQDNGGLTQTIALLDDSPAIDGGSNPHNLAFDQRGAGFQRTVGNGTDIGAYEVQTMINNADIVGTDNRDILRGTPSGDRIFGLGGDDFIQGLDGNDSIDGGNGSDRILSGSGINTIIDGAGDDILLGGADDDIFLAANAGNDLFRGDTGKDIYVYDLNDNGLFDRDRIIDFEQREDQIAFRTLVNDPQSLDNFADLDTDNSGVLDELDERIQISNSSTVIDFSDIFGRPQGSDTITLIGVTNLDSDNFLFDEATIGTEFG